MSLVEARSYEESSVMAMNLSVSVIVPTYREAESLPDLIARLEPLRSLFEGFEVIVVDDNSQDGTEELLSKMRADDWVHLIIRKTERGLSSAVIEGCRAAKNSVLVVMDADLSHPPESIPAIVQILSSGEADFVIGSRYCEGGKIEEGWGLFRKVNSLIATLLARPFTKAKDPMSGFLALKRDDFLKSAPLNPIGYKIGLEFIVKCGFTKIREVPITFEDRKKGQSKLSLGEQLKYLRHIKRLSDFKFGNLSFLIQFSIVGVSGFLVNVLAVTFLSWIGIPLKVTFALGILIAMSSNFLLNRSITFDHGISASFFRQYFQFVAACAVGAVINYIASLLFLAEFPQFAQMPQVPVVVGSIAGLVSNFIFSRYIVFGKNLILNQKK